MGRRPFAAFRTVLRDQPEQARIQSLLGQAHVITGEGLLARESFERAVSLYPGLVDSTLALAMLDSQSGQLARARTRLRDVVSTHPDHLPAIEMLFALDLMAGDWKQAKTSLSLLRSLVGESAMLFHGGRQAV